VRLTRGRAQDSLKGMPAWSDTVSKGTSFDALHHYVPQLPFDWAQGRLSMLQLGLK